MEGDRDDDDPLLPMGLWASLQQGRGTDGEGRYGHAAVLVAGGREAARSEQQQQPSLVVVGGADGAGGFGGGLAVSVFDLRRRRWAAMKGPSGPAPPARHFHSVVGVRRPSGDSEGSSSSSSSSVDEVWVYGGKSNGYHNDLATYAPPPHHAWLRPSSPAPPPPGLLARYGHSAIAFGRHLYVFGGYDQHGFVCDDVWRLSRPSLRWKKADSVRVEGLARYHHTAVVHDRSMFVWGGKSTTGNCGAELYEYHFDTGRWSVVHTRGLPPSPRWGHTAVADRRAMYIFGGTDGATVYNHLHAYSFLTRTWSQVAYEEGAVPAPRYFHACAGWGDTLYVVGGKDKRDECWLDVWAYRSSVFDFGPADGGEHVPHTPQQQQQQPKAAEKKKGRGKGEDAAHPPRPKPTTGSSSSSSSSSEAGAAIRLKCHWEEEIRVLGLSADIGYAGLLEKLEIEYGHACPPDAQLAIQYRDQEGDLITVRSEPDLREAFEHLGLRRLAAAAGPPPTLKLYLNFAPARPSRSSLGGGGGKGEQDEGTASPATPPHRQSQQQQQQGRGRAAFAAASGGGVGGEAEAGSTSSDGRRGSSPRAGKAFSPSSSSSSSSKDRSGGVDRDDPAEAPARGLPCDVLWQKGPMLGKGAFGTVFEALDVRTGELVAVKELVLPASPSGQEVAAIRAVEREVEVMRSLQHPNIVRYLGAQVGHDDATTSRYLHIFIELIPGGSLAAFIRRYGRCREPLMAGLVRQILEGLAYLHAHGFAHRDLKAANLLLAPDGTLKLADFGCSKKVDIVSLTQGCTTLTGTPHYMAPEVVLGKPYGRKADLWSVGAVLVEMATGQPPWAELVPVAALFKLGSPDAVPAIPAFLSADARHFLSLCFTRDPTQRPSAKELLAHPFLRDSPSRPSPLFASTPHQLAFQQVPAPETTAASRPPATDHRDNDHDDLTDRSTLSSAFRLSIGFGTVTDTDMTPYGTQQ